MFAKLAVRLLILLAVPVFLLPACARSHPWSKDLGAVKDAPAPEKRSFKFLERDIKGLRVTSLEELAKLPDEEVDIATGALLVSKLLNPDLDIKKYQKILDNMAKELAEYLQKPLTPRQVIERFRQYLFANKNLLAGVTVSHYTQGTQKEAVGFHLLDGVLDKNKGSCFSLSLLYLSLAERLGADMRIVTIPSMSVEQYGHVFIRYIGKLQKLNIETTKRGIEIPLTFYKEEFKAASYISPECLETDLSRKQVIASLCCNLSKIVRERKGSLETVRLLLNLARLFDQENPRMLSLLADVLIETGHKDKGLELLKETCHVAPGDYAATHNLLVYSVRFGKYNTAVEAVRRFINKNPRHPAVHVMQLFLYSMLADYKLDTRYRLNSMKEVDKAMTFVREYRKKHPDQIFPEEEILLEELPVLLERRKQELLREKEK